MVIPQFINWSAHDDTSFMKNRQLFYVYKIFLFNNWECACESSIKNPAWQIILNKSHCWLFCAHAEEIVKFRYRQVSNIGRTFVGN